jgi:hypothetical protein
MVYWSSLRSARAAICVLVLLCVAGAFVAWEPWRGPITLSLSAEHGFHVADLPALLLVAAAVAVARRRTRARAGNGLVPSVAAVAFGVLLLLAGVGARAGGGALVPAGGGTLAGTIVGTFARHSVPVDRWSHLAVTYDGARLRLYVDGREVADRAAAGRIQTSPDPLWMGGNRPYGEHFDGAIDEVRVYDRALSEREIRHDMATPVAPAPGLVAGYGFDAGSGRVAADASGRGNTGEIRGATWTRGRYGGALRFDGRGAVVRVPPSRSLDLTRAMTLSGWVRPGAAQPSWRTLVQRQTDAYGLQVGSDRQVRTGAIDNLRAALLVAAGAWFCALLAMGRTPRTSARSRSWWLAPVLFLAGSAVDAALVPSATLFGAIFVAAWLAATAPGAAERVLFVAAGLVCLAVSIKALGPIAGGPDAVARDQGAIARTTAVGALFVLAGLCQLAGARRSASDVAAAHHVPHGA